MCSRNHHDASSGLSFNDLLAGQVSLTCDSLVQALPYIRAGRLKALAVLGPKRTPLLPDVPSIKESIPKFDYSGWNGLLAPKSTPKVILARLRTKLLEVAKKPQFIEQFAAQGAQVVTSTPEEFREFVRQEIASSGAVVRAAGLKIE